MVDVEGHNDDDERLVPNDLKSLPGRHDNSKALVQELVVQPEPALEGRGHVQKAESVSKFALIPTSNQNHKDCLEKEKSNIRMACLEVAAESYKSANLDVPDVSLLELIRICC